VIQSCSTVVKHGPSQGVLRLIHCTHGLSARSVRFHRHHISNVEVTSVAGYFPLSYAVMEHCLRFHGHGHTACIAPNEEQLCAVADGLETTLRKTISHKSQSY